jgi:hypothetical protein
VFALITGYFVGFHSTTPGAGPKYSLETPQGQAIHQHIVQMQQMQMQQKQSENSRLSALFKNHK